MSHRDITFIEVCSGCGGLSTGLEQAGLTPILLNEIEKVFCDTLRRNHPGVRIENCSMTDLSLTEFKGTVDLLTGGVPCQSFSHAGLRRGLEDARGSLAVDFNRLINECKPNMFLVENVKGIISHNNGETLRSLIELYSNRGEYTVQYKLLNAYEYGVPQKRERVMIVGVKTELITAENRIFEFPSPVPKNERKVLRDVLYDVPEPTRGIQYSERKRYIMEKVPPGGCWVNLPRELQIEYMGEKMLTSGGGKRGVARRMSYDEPCLTLTTSPSQKQTERCHPSETRPFNIREYARIQTFPDSYEFCGSIGQQYKQIGNAVPVVLAKHIGLSVKHMLSVIL